MIGSDEASWREYAGHDRRREGRQPSQNSSISAIRPTPTLVKSVIVKRHANTSGVSRVASADMIRKPIPPLPPMNSPTTPPLKPSANAPLPPPAEIRSPVY